MNINKAIVIGRITSEIKLTNSNGQTVAKFGVATNKTWKDKGGNKQEKTTFHNISAWGSKADTINKWFHKGDEIYIEGEITNTVKENTDGTKTYFSGITLDKFDFGQKVGSKPIKKSDPNEEYEKEEELPIIEEEAEKINNDDIPF